MNTNLSFPHPVLGNSDDFIVNNFNLSVRTRLFDRHYEYRITLDIGNQHGDYEEFVANGDFVYCVQVICSRLYFRKYFSSKEKTIEFKTNQGELYGNVEFTGFIVSYNNLSKFKPSGQNEEFYIDASYDLETGDIIGISNTLKEWVEPEFENQDQRKKKAIIAIIKDENSNKDYYKVGNWGDDQLKIGIPKKHHEKWFPLNKKEYEHFNICSIILPILTEAIDKVKSQDERESLSGTKWWETIEANLVQNELYNTDVDKSAIAQILLNGPLKDYVIQLKSVNDLIEYNK